MSIAAYIREIGRGKEGARSLNAMQAHDLMSQVLDGRVDQRDAIGFGAGGVAVVVGEAAADAGADAAAGAVRWGCLRRGDATV
mgnify:CR=1 FL=1